ncbi:alpha/beta fold hydrolase [Gryllotalpicola ginsengisoli]|uniref:alpha/beta fold hydrolase n=1 Tax=Gryllotalpicola ginsengisoli TaxID=444608 RepID=UPI0003B42B81|nr:alpha/beta fold hydrolase [Gryllotalpicola ginsengisoli]
MELLENPLDGTRISYRVFGDGATDAPAVVLVHGTALSQAIWRGFGWVRELQQQYRVITLDLRGHGRSDKPYDEDAYDQALFVADVLTVLDTLEVRSAHYIGYSLGGRVGFELAASHPGRLASLVTLGGSPRTGQGVFDRTFFPGCIDTIVARGMQAFVDRWAEHLGHPLDNSTQAALLANDGKALAAYMRKTEEDPGVPVHALSTLTLPLLMIAGTEDHSRVRAAARVQSLLPRMPVRLLDGATHGRTPRHPDALPAVRQWLADQG